MCSFYYSLENLKLRIYGHAKINLQKKGEVAAFKECDKCNREVVRILKQSHNVL